MNHPLNILFLCTINQMRSKTAEEIYKSDKRFHVKSAGVAEDATVMVDHDMLLWADYIICMEEKHRRRLAYLFPDIYPNLRIFCLGISDIYYCMAPELISLIKQSFEELYQTKMAGDHDA